VGGGRGGVGGGVSSPPTRVYSEDFVVQVSAGLRNFGFDVWRDEDGSNLVRKMMGSSMEIMAKAIELAGE
jgi:hypothetical protein